MTPANRSGAIAFLAVVAAGAGYYVWKQHERPSAPPTAPATPQAAPATAPIASPVTQPDGAISTTDAGLAVEIATQLGFSALPDFVYPDGVIRRFVATVDALPREQLPFAVRVLRPMAGTFAAEGGEEHPSVARANAARYARVVDGFEHVPPAAAGELYQRLYPRFQQSFEELGFAGRSFHTRLLAVIDNLLAAPDAADATPLARPKVLFLYADPALEGCSAGQKALLRSGARNEARLKAQLRRLRAEIASRPPR